MAETAVPLSVQSDIPCLGCGYNLRGLPPQGLCPECGRPIELSLRGNLLRYAEPRRLGILIRGLRMVQGSVTAVILGLVAAATTFGLGALLVPWFGRDIWPWVPRLAFIVLFAPIAYLPVIYPLGWWLATQPDPAESPQDRTRRLMLRISALLFFPVYSIWLARPMLGWPWLGAPLMVEVSTHIAFGLIWLHTYLMVRCLRDLYHRCHPPNAGEAREQWAKFNSALKWCELFPAFLIGIHWIYGLFHLDTATLSLTPPAPQRGIGSGVGFVLITFLWIGRVGMCGYVLKAIREERDAASPNEPQRRRDTERDVG